MKPLPRPDIKKASSFPLVWLVPIVALLVGAFMTFRELKERGPRITIVFEEASGLRAGETVLQYKGVEVGRVESVALAPDLARVEAVVALQRSARAIARDGSRFWILRPEIGLEGIRGLDTLISGPTIQVTPGDGRPKKFFQGLERAPFTGSDLGYNYVLRVNGLGSLRIGSPVLYRDFKVGQVVGSELAPDATSVLVRIMVEAPYHRLVRADTVFWNASGLAMKVGLLGARIQTQSLESMFAGGILFATPESADAAEPAPQGAMFDLHAEPESGWLEWQPSIPLSDADPAPSAP